VLLASNHATASVDVPMNTQGFVPDRRIVIEDDVWLGAGVTVLPGRRIGRGAIVGAGAVVVTDVPPFAVAAGNPAVVLHDRRERAARSDRPDRPQGQS
jgi:maltose O-acetyltransferase